MTIQWKWLLMPTSTLLLYACAASNPPSLSEAHLAGDEIVQVEKMAIPKAVNSVPMLPPPQATAPLETYTVVASEVSIKELLFELVRDNRLNVDIHPDIEGTVTLNAVDQTLPQIMDRIAKQVDLRYQLDGSNLVISPDIPYWRNYTINYVNLSRESISEVGVATRIATAGGSVGGSGSNDFGNISTTTVKSESRNHFWQLIETNLKQILDITEDTSEGDRGGSTSTEGDGSKESRDGEKKKVTASVIANPAGGVISVRASHVDHQQIQHFLDQIMASALRQVLIEMTIVEVELSDRYQAGINWESLTAGDGFDVISSLTGTNLTTAPFFSLGYSDSSSRGNMSATLRMLESFGDVKVLSSPKIMALNNQTALLKVVDEKVYFTVDMEIANATDNSPEKRTFTSQIHTVPVGMMLNVTPQITEQGIVTLNIRPTISRITGFVKDPAAALAGVGVDNLIPEIQVRELESLLQVSDGQMVVMGGLMQNKVKKNRSGVPILSSLPIVGDLFSYRDEEFTKTELVIFLRPTVVKSGGLGVDLEAYRAYLPDADSWSAERGAPSLNLIKMDE
ncbi:MAG: pilus (MSHA type) biogenesis protein MshL [Candidatus Polarisedimenticolaceae bacterium]|nr:pilus (MSHA type) biogenesis protein MshL [Candidatus Polarisedimenticolaceae bacterium]